MRVNEDNLNPTKNISIEDILLSAQESASNGTNTQTVGGHLATQREIEMRNVIPRNLRIGNITFRKPAEALGEEVMSTFSRGKSYTYYRASKYKIKVIYKPTREVAYESSFDIRYNNIPAESKRKVEQMSGNLEPALTVSLDIFRLGAGGQSQFGMGSNGGSVGEMGLQSGANLQATHNNQVGGSNYNGGFYNEVRYEVDSSLASIGVYAGIKTKVFVTWELQNSNGSISDVRQELEYNYNKGRKLLPGIVRGYKDATIQYISEIDNAVLVELPMDLVTGDTFCKSCEEAQDRENRARLDAAAEQAQRHTGGDRMRGAVEEFRYGEMDGGFSHEGGGFSPMQEGAFESMRFDASGNSISVSGVGAGAFNGVQGAQGVGANVQQGIGR